MNWKRGMTMLLAGTLLLTGLAGCGNNNETGSGSAAEGTGTGKKQNAEVESIDSFVLAYNQIDGLDPLSCTTEENQMISQLCFERLFVLDENFEPHKQLCDTFEQTDTNLYTLTIRSDAMFHSGQPVTAEDVTYSLNNARLRDDSIYQDQLACVSSVRCNGDEVYIHLYEQNANLAALLDVPVIRKGTDEDDCPDGSGPYQYVVSDEHSRLIPSEEWSGGEVGFCKSITLMTVSDNSGAENLFSSGELSLLTQSDAESAAVQGIKYSTTVPTTRLHYLGINCDLEPFDNKDVRAALSLLLDRETIAETCFAGKADAASLPLASIPEDTDIPAFDMEEALDLLKDAGIYDRDDDGFLDIDRGYPFKMTIIYNENYSTKGAVLAQYAETLNEAGIETTISPLSFEKCQAQLRDESFRLYYGEYEMTADFDLSSLISTNGERNFSGYYDKEMEAAIKDFASAYGEEREGAVEEYIACFVEQTPIIPIAFERATVISTIEFPENFDPWPDNIFHNIALWSAS